MKVAIYARVSTTDQSTANQIIDLENYAARLDYQVVAEYQEQETAWRQGHQAELARLLDDAHKWKFDIVLVWSLDRLTREGPLSILKLVDRFKQMGVKVLSYKESWTAAPGELGDLLYAITGWVGRFESNRRSEATKAGLARRRAEGKRLGRPPGSKDGRKRKRR